MLIERDMSRKKNTSGGWIKTRIALMIVIKTEINTWQRTRCEFMSGGGGNVRKAETTKDTKRRIVRMFKKKRLKRSVMRA